MASKKRRVIMLAISKDNVAMIATPPRHQDDIFADRATRFCTIPHIKNITIDWEGNIYIVNQWGDMFVGPMPTSANMNWYDAAQKVAILEFSRYMYIFFHPNGDLWGVTNDGRLYTGPPPTNKHLTWTYGEAKLIGHDYHQFDAIFFDVTGTLYAISNDGTFYKGPPPTPGTSWTERAATFKTGNWHELSYLMLPDADGNLWGVSRWTGNIFKGPMPNLDDDYRSYFKQKCKNQGPGFFQMKFICMTVDKTIESIFGCEFLPEKGKRTSESTEALDEKIYDNRKSSNVLKHTFRYSKKVKETSTFSHEHGFTFGFGLETSFSAGVPGIGQAGTTVTMNASTSHNWSFSEENETEDTLETSADVEVEPGQAIRVVASVKKAKLEVAYRAHIRTMFGKDDYIEGIWKGATNYNLVVVQEDYNC